MNGYNKIDYAVNIVEAYRHAKGIAGLCQDGGVHDGERNIQKTGYSLGHQGFTRSGGTHEEDIGLLYLYFVFILRL